MRIIRNFAWLALTLCGSLLSTVAAQTATSAPATGPASTTATASSTKPASTYIHPGTKFEFPEKLDGFTRIEVTKYAADESDVSAGYNATDPDNPIVITVYVFPAPPLIAAPGDGPDAAKTRQFDRALTAIKKEIAHEHEDAKIVSEADFTLKEGDRSHKGIKVTYEMSYTIAGHVVPTASDMILIVEGKWQIEYRISYPKAFAKTTPALIEKFLASLTWYGN